MKRGVILSASVLLMVFFSIAAVAVSETNLKQKSVSSENKAGQSAKTLPSEERLSTDVNSEAEPNAPEALGSAELEKSLGRLDRQSKAEMIEWLKLENEKKIDLAKAVHKQIRAELKFIRRVAEAEGATKTVESIDNVLKSRNKRFKKLSGDAEKEKAKASVQQLREREGAEEEQGIQTREPEQVKSKEEKKKELEERRANARKSRATKDQNDLDQ